MPSAMPAELAQAILDGVRAGARVINLSLSVVASSTRDEHRLEAALSYAAARGVIVVAAAGNQGEVGGSPGLRAPSENIASLGPTGKIETFSGTSATSMPSIHRWWGRC
jgi:subtilisin family serine protease